MVPRGRCFRDSGLGRDYVRMDASSHGVGVFRLRTHPGRRRSDQPSALLSGCVCDGQSGQSRSAGPRLQPAPRHHRGSHHRRHGYRGPALAAHRLRSEAGLRGVEFRFRTRGGHLNGLQDPVRTVRLRLARSDSARLRQRGADDVSHRPACRGRRPRPAVHRRDCDSRRQQGGC